jgi:ABC-2 type transport system permease protein
MLTLLFTSVPLLFLSGFSWPVESFPWGFEALSQLFPSTPGIKGIIKVCVMGTPLSAAGKELMSLWVMAAVFFFANWIILQRTYTRNLRVIELMRRGR